MKKRLFLLLVICSVYACTKNKGNETTVDCSGPAKSFASDVMPVIQASCTTGSGCHGSGSNNGPGALVNYTQIFNAHADIRSAVASRHMPLNGSLSATEMNAILCWIDNGAPSN
jgi:hypothetical protein